MSIRSRMASVAIIAILLGAGAVALFQTDRAPEPAPRPTEVAEPRATGSPSQPPAAAGSATSAIPADPAGALRPGGGEPPTLTWQVPKEWQVVPSPNPMRIATYRTSASPDENDPVEVSVSRAGGSVDANIQRWLGQFKDPENPRRAEATVHQVPVTFVEMSGTYTGGMMGGASPAGPRPGYALVAVIAQPPGSPYFFKMLGPAQKVRESRKTFDAMVESFSPR